MTRPARMPVARLALAACFSLGLLSVGCGDGGTKGSQESLAYDPAKSKSQEDSMKKAAQEAARAPK